MLDEIIVDSFAGGGGASTGIEMALGRSPDFAINHDPEALALHRANHPETVHLSQNIYKVDPISVVHGRKVGLFWASPDCKHFSKAKGGTPVQREIRDLAWIVVQWAQRVRPRVIILENVEEFQTWGPLIEVKPGKFKPDPTRSGETFTQWVAALRAEGYRVEWRELRASDYGAPTTRKRLFVIARCDGLPIVWPDATHGDPDSLGVSAGRLLPWRTAAEIIDWSEPCPSIFDTAAEIKAKFGVRAIRPLAPATLARIAKGVKRYVIDAAKPFVVNLTHGGRVEPVDAPVATVTAAHRGEKALVAPLVVKNNHGDKPHYRADEPMRTIVAGGTHHALVAPVLSSAQHGGSLRSADEPHRTIAASDKDQNQLVAAHVVGLAHGESGGRRQYSAEEPLTTVHAGGNNQALVAAFLAQHNTDMVGHAASEPVSTIVQKGCTQAVVEVSAGLLNQKGSAQANVDLGTPVPTICAGANHVVDVRAFLLKYYGNEAEGHDPQAPLATVTTKDRFGLVTVEGEDYALVDIGMRMLTPRELFRAQGFPARYEIETGDFDGERRPLSKTAQVRMCGNSVCPPIAAALVAANCADLRVMREAAE